MSTQPTPPAPGAGLAQRREGTTRFAALWRSDPDAYRAINPVRYNPPSPVAAPSATTISDGTARETIDTGGMGSMARELLTRLDAEARNGAAWCSLRASRWDRVYLTLGLPAAVLAAIAGATALASTTTRLFSGVVALCAAGVTSAAAFLDSKNRQQHYDDLAGAWSALRADIEQLVTFDLSRVTETALHIGELQRAGVQDEERVRRGRSALRSLEDQLRRAVEELQERHKELLAGRVPPPADPSLKRTGAAIDDSWY